MENILSTSVCQSWCHNISDKLPFVLKVIIPTVNTFNIASWKLNLPQTFSVRYSSPGIIQKLFCIFYSVCCIYFTISECPLLIYMYPITHCFAKLHDRLFSTDVLLEVWMRLATTIVIFCKGYLRVILRTEPIYCFITVAHLKNEFPVWCSLNIFISQYLWYRPRSLYYDTVKLT